jgi:hypothetical protein
VREERGGGETGTGIASFYIGEKRAMERPVTAEAASFGRNNT